MPPRAVPSGLRPSAAAAPPPPKAVAANAALIYRLARTNAKMEKDNKRQPPPFRRATSFSLVQTSTSAEDTRHSLRSCLVSSASVAVCTRLHYVALLHSKRYLSVTASQTGLFIGWRDGNPSEKINPLGPPRLTITSRDGPRGERSNIICRLPPEKPSRRFYENRKRWFGYGV